MRGERRFMGKAQSVFLTGKARIMSYDGRYRVGCDGLLYILLETLY
jgi:xanthine dehydrogenase accessory factor